MIESALSVHEETRLLGLIDVIVNKKFHNSSEDAHEKFLACTYIG